MRDIFCTTVYILSSELYLICFVLYFYSEFHIFYFQLYGTKCPIYCAEVPLRNCSLTHSLLSSIIGFNSCVFKGREFLYNGPRSMQKSFLAWS